MVYVPPYVGSPNLSHQFAFVVVLVVVVDVADVVLVVDVVVFDVEVEAGVVSEVHPLKMKEQIIRQEIRP